MCTHVVGLKERLGNLEGSLVRVCLDQLNNSGPHEGRYMIFCIPLVILGSVYKLDCAFDSECAFDILSRKLAVQHHFSLC